MIYNHKNIVIIRAGNGGNLKISKHGFFSIKHGKGKKTILQKNLKPGDVIVFIGSKKYKQPFVYAFATFTHLVDTRMDAVLIPNEEQNWQGINPDEYTIQIHYKDYYAADIPGIPKIQVCISNPQTVLPYNDYMEKIPENLYYHHEQFKRYGTPKVFM